MRRILVFLAVTIFSLSAYSQVVRVSPQWTPQAQFTGLYVADSLGFYEELGLDVEIIHPSATRNSFQMLETGDTDIIICQFADALTFNENNLRIVNILQCNENNALMIVSREPLQRPKDLYGKRIGHWKAGFSNLGFIMDRQLELDVEWIPFHSNIALYISGAIDATLAMEYNEYFQLKLSGTPLDNSQVLYFRDCGFNVQEDGFYVTPKYLSRNKERLSLFVEATKKGWEWAREHQEEALDIVMDILERHSVHSNRVNQQFMLATILRLQENDEGVAPYILTKERFEEAVNLFINEGYLKRTVSYEDFVKTF